MAQFSLKSIQQILGDLIANVSANTPLTDINAASVILTLLEAVGTEDANTYIQMLNIIRAFNLDTTTGQDLVDRAFEYGLTPIQAAAASGFVTFSDTAFAKVQTNVYTGLPGPSAGNTTINIVSATGFPGGGGNVIIGRGTNNTETIHYGAIVNLGTFSRLTLTAPLTKDHGTDETVILAQGGDRVIPAGTSVYAPESDLRPQVDFVLQANSIILDGEVSVAGNTVICTATGNLGNVSVGAVKFFGSTPFPTAAVTNPASFTTGRDLEIDQALRERIRATIQSLSKGTLTALLTAIAEVVSTEQNNRVVSDKFREATTLNQLNFMFIDDGIGLEPLLAAEATQDVIEVAQGGEQFVQLDNEKTPIAKATLKTLNEEPFGITPGQTLTVRVNHIDQTITFGGADMFVVPGAATAEEVVAAMNDNLSLIEARTADNRTKVVIEAQADTNEQIRVVGGTANQALSFKEGVDVLTLKLYKNDVLLNKDGENAQTVSAAEPGGGFGPGNPSTLLVIVDTGVTTQTVTFTGQNTAQEIVTAINAQISGAQAFVDVVGAQTFVLLQSTNPISGNSRIHVTGGTANPQLGFDTSVHAGTPKDYALNKYNGQLELTTVLVANDELLIGSPNTRAYIESTQPENTLTPTPYNVAIGDTLVVQIDDIVDSAVTLNIDASNFRDASLVGSFPRDNHFVPYFVRFKNTTATVALHGIARRISTYNNANGQLTTAAFPAVPAIGDVYEIVQIGVATANLTMTADQVQQNIASICPEIQGLSFYGKQKNLNRFLRVQTNSQSSRGRIKIHAASTMTGAGKLSLPVSVVGLAQESNFGFIESGNEPGYNNFNLAGHNFTFGRGQQVLFVLDNDVTYKTITIVMDINGSVTTSVDASNFRDAALVAPYPTTGFFIGMRVRFTGATLTAAIRNEIRIVTAYNGGTGAVTVNAPYSAVPVVGDTYEIIPTSTKNVVDLFNNSNFTNLKTYAVIESSDNGTHVQITSKTQGTAGSVRCAGGTANAFTIPLLTPGTGLGQFTVDTIEGLSIGLQLWIQDNNTGRLAITITNIVGVGSPFAVTCAVDSGGTNLTAFTVDQAARIFARNQFAFDLGPSEGVDGYKYYQGLIQQAQWTLDGKDTDFTHFPGVKAAGVMIEVKAPVVKNVAIVIDVSTADGVTLTAVKSDVKSAISNYINNLGVGQDVVLSEIIATVMAITGIVDARIVIPSSNIAIAANELPRIVEFDVTVG